MKFYFYKIVSRNAAIPKRSPDVDAPVLTFRLVCFPHFDIFKIDLIGKKLDVRY